MLIFQKLSLKNILTQPNLNPNPNNRWYFSKINLTYPNPNLTINAYFSKFNLAKYPHQTITFTLTLTINAYISKINLLTKYVYPNPYPNPSNKCLFSEINLT